MKGRRELLYREEEVGEGDVVIWQGMCDIQRQLWKVVYM